MSDIVLESFRASVMGLILVYLGWIGRKEQLHQQRGWTYIVAGSGLVFLGGIFDITDNFDDLNRFIVIGDTVAEAFIEKAVGFLVGYILIFVGFLYWLPLVAAVRRAEEQLKSHGEELEREVDSRTRELTAANARLLQQIAERETAEEAQKESDERFRDLFENANDCRPSAIMGHI